MEIQIHARNLDVNPRLQDYVDKKLNRLDRYLPNITEIRLDLTKAHYKSGADRSIAQLTVRSTRGLILRAEDKTQDDIFAAVDVVTDKMYTQISKYKGKRRRKMGERFESMEPELAAAEATPVVDEVEEVPAQIMRRKRLEMIPMSEDEAIDQLELLQHDFFVFFNASTNAVSVLYKRDDGNYGILEPVAF